jgi:hypothetical protein
MPVRAIFSIVGRSGPGIAIAVAGLVLVVAIGGSTVIPDLITQVEKFVWGFLAVGVMLSLLWAGKFLLK